MHSSKCVSWLAYMLGKRATYFLWVLPFLFGISSAGSRSSIKTLGPENGTLEYLREKYNTKPTQRKTLYYRIVPVDVTLYREEVRPGCYKEAYLVTSTGEFTTRAGPFITALDITWIRCDVLDDFIVMIDGKQLHLPHLRPITRPDERAQILVASAIDFAWDQRWTKAAEVFMETNRFAWEVMKYSLLNCTFKGNKGYLIGYSRNTADSYYIVDDNVYGLTESSATSQVISNLMKISPLYWLIKIVLSFFNEDLETMIQTTVDSTGEFVKNIYFFTTKGVLLYLAAYYVTRMLFGDGWVGMLTSLAVSHIIRYSDLYT